jgi:hypothetical protein
LDQADEFKLIIEETGSMEKWTDALPLHSHGSPVWLHPEWSKARAPDILRSINNWVKEHGAPYRAGYQLHKLYKTDEEDERSRPSASLSHLPDDGK